jgi:hypothetical protein
MVISSQAKRNVLLSKRDAHLLTSERYNFRLKPVAIRTPDLSRAKELHASLEADQLKMRSLRGERLLKPPAKQLKESQFVAVPSLPDEIDQ